MKRLLPVLVCCLARAAAAQTTPLALSGETDTYQPQNVNVRNDGHCTAVRPGDTVHYTLTIEGVGLARKVYGDLRLRSGRFHEPFSGNLPVPDFRSLGGGGLGARDAGDAKMYHFAFKVPQEILGGTYRGAAVNVHADLPQPGPRPVLFEEEQRTPKVEVSRRTRDEVHGYCLNVMSNFGVNVHFQPVVTKFEPGAVDPPAAPPAPPKPLPPVQQLPPPQPGPPPQPR